MNYFCEMTEREIELDKQIRRENIKEIICGIFAAICMVVLTVLYVLATPDQYTAERDIIAEQFSNQK